MVRIGETNIPDKKQILYALTEIYGIGLSSSKKILQQCVIPTNFIPQDLTPTQINKINQEIEKYSTGKALQKKINEDKKLLIKTGNRRGLRAHVKDFITGKFRPVHGQKSRHNAQTAKCGARPGKRIKIAIAGKKAAPTPK